MSDLALFEEVVRAPSGNHDRFGSRWHLTGFGLEGIWQYGSMRRSLPSGRMLLRGGNGVGKTTALEMLLPFLLDLDIGRGKLAAGKSRSTTLSTIMGGDKDNRVGFGWLTFTSPDGDVISYGAKLSYRATAETPVTITGFTIPGVPGEDMPLLKPGHLPIVSDGDLRELVTAAGGETFPDRERAAYRAHIARTVFGVTVDELKDVCGAIREVRDPAKLAAMSPDRAADVVKASLPTVSRDVRDDVADSLRKLDSAGQAVAASRKRADALEDLRTLWSRYAAGLLLDDFRDLENAQKEHSEAQSRLMKAIATAEDAASRHDTARLAFETGQRRHEAATTVAETLRNSDELRNAKDAIYAGEQAHGAERRAEIGLENLRTGAADFAGDVEEAATTIQEQLDGVREIIDEACGKDVNLPRLLPPASLQHTATSPLRAGGHSVNMPEELAIREDAEQWQTLSESWARRDTELQGIVVSAGALIRAHEPVAKAADAASRASDAVSGKEEQYETAHAAQREAKADAGTIRGALVADIEAWAAQHAGLTDADALEDLAGADIEATIPIVEEISSGVHSLLDNRIAGLKAEEITESTLATDLGEQRRRLIAEAEGLRAGKLPAIPRPADAPRVTDEITLLGSALVWRDDVDEHTRGRVEDALVRTGVLGARLGEPIEGIDWRVDPISIGQDESLGALIGVDPTHPDARAARAVLEQIRLTDHAAPGSGFAVGTDGSYRVGPLLWTPGELPAPAAQYIGLAQRRAAALRRAAELDAEAEGLRQQILDVERRVQELKTKQRTWMEARSAFPSSSALLQAVATWRASFRLAAIAEEAVQRARTERARAAHHATQLRTTWQADARTAGFPAELEQIKSDQEIARAQKQSLDGATKRLQRLRDALSRTHMRLTSLVAKRARLVESAAQTDAAAQGATQLRMKEATLKASLGKSTDEILADLETASNEAAAAKEALSGLQIEYTTSADAAGSARTAQQYADAELARYGPVVEDALAHLRARMTIVETQAWLLQGTPMAESTDELANQCRVMVATLLDGKEPLREVNRLSSRKDELVASVIDEWLLAEHEEAGVRVYIMTSGQDSMALPAAARRAAEERDRALSFLDDESQRNMRDLVLNGIPKSLHNAWEDMQAWVKQTNALLWDASASSGLRVQLAVDPLPDLPETERTILALGCRKSASARTVDERERLAQALRTLLNVSSRGDDEIDDFVAEQLDVRNLVRVRFMVVRTEGGAPEAWTSRTGLSNGESVLVVVSPLLAGLAGKFNAMRADALRIVALDEVPAAVDTKGRDGLARFIAALDMDLIATSHGWDGAPGAWDGIDIIKLRRAGDLVVETVDRLRGREGPSLPGDDGLYDMEEDVRWT